MEGVMEVLTKGTVEVLIVPLADRLKNISDLDDVTGKLFDIKRKSDDGAVITNGSWFTDADYPMYALCNIDTTDSDFTPGDEYKLYLKWDSGAEQVRKGPFYFRVEDD
jgi:hypothetical protein